MLVVSVAAHTGVVWAIRLWIDPPMHLTTQALRSHTRQHSLSPMQACEVWLDHVLRKCHTPVTSIVQLSRDTLLVALTGWFTDVNLLRSPSIHPRPRTGAEMAANIEVCMGLLADAGVDLEGIRWVVVVGVSWVGCM